MPEKCYSQFLDSCNASSANAHWLPGCGEKVNSFVRPDVGATFQLALGCVWSLALLGSIYEAFYANKSKVIDLSLFVGLGAIPAIAMAPYFVCAHYANSALLTPAEWRVRGLSFTYPHVIHINVPRDF